MIVLSSGFWLLLMLTSVRGANQSLSFECAAKGSNLRTFADNGHELQKWIDSDKKYILYAEENKLHVTGQYTACKDSNQALCLCAFHIRTNNSYYYADHCFINRYEPIDLIRSYSSPVSETINCTKFKIFDASDPNEWLSVPAFGNNFKCAVTQNEKTFLVRIHSGNSSPNSKALFLRIERDLSGISIDKTESASDLSATELTGGLCGSIRPIDTDGTCFSFTTTENVCERDLAELARHWTIENLGLSWNLPEVSELLFPTACVSDNQEPTLKSFKQIAIDKTTAISQTKQFYTLFTDTSSDLMVTVRYQACSSNAAKLCNCAIYVKVGNDASQESKYAFVDFCDADPSRNYHWKFYTSLSVVEVAELSLSSSFEALNCSRVIQDPSNDQDWTTIPMFRGSFKCAKILTKNCETSFLRVTFSAKTVLVKLDHKCSRNGGQTEYLPNVKVIPSSPTPFTTGGLCGNTVPNQCHLFSESYANINQSSCQYTSSSLGVYWKTTEKNHLKTILSSPSHQVECKTFNYDPAIQTFRTNLVKAPKLVDMNNSYVLYDHNLHTIVASKYTNCDISLPNAKLCNCGVYVRLNRTTTHFAFIDFCGSDSRKIETFSYYDETTSARYPYQNISCGYQINDEDDDEEWNRVSTSFGHFKCATLKDNSCKTLVLKTVGDEYSNIKVKVDAHCSEMTEFDPLAQITVNPSVRSEEFSKGFCGQWSLNEDDDLCITGSDLGMCKSTGNIDELIGNFSMKSYERTGLIKSNVNQAIVMKNTFVPVNNIDTNLKCKSSNDPHMTTIRGNKYEFQRAGDFYFYSYNYGLRVVLVYQQCDRRGRVFCNCGLYITVDIGTSSESTLFLDKCNSAEKTIKERTTKNTSEFDPNKCTLIDPEDFENWKYLHKEEKSVHANQFYCMKTCDKYHLRIMKKKMTSVYEAQISFSLSESTISQVFLSPSLNSTDEAGGICGRKGDKCERFYKNQTNHEYCANDSRFNFTNYVDYWRVKNRINDTAKRMDLGVDPQLILNSRVYVTDLQRAEAKMFPSPSLKITEAEARYTCEKLIRDENNVKISNPNAKLANELEEWKQEKIRMCILDLEDTGDAQWAQVHSKLLKNDIIDQILRVRSNFDGNMVIKDQTLIDYKIKCPNDCSGPTRGTCVKNQACRFDTGCAYVVKCHCKDPYGASDCSVNLRVSPVFELAQKCCDSRSMNCDRITAVGQFSDIDELIVKIVSEKDNTNSIDYYTLPSDSKHLNIKFPYGSFPEIRESHQTIKIGLSYGKSDFYWQKIDFYDSRCRSCNEDYGVSDNLTSNTCLAGSGECSYFVKDYEAIAEGNPGATKCYEPSPCNSVFDVGIIMHSSSNTNQETFQSIKNSIAELLGRFNLGQNRVHAGLMYYGKQTGKSVTLDPREQLNKKTIIQRAINLPYVPLPMAPVSRALSYAKDSLFSRGRKTKMTIPRIAVLINTMAGDDGDAAANANLLKNNGIELVTIGIGNRANANSLSSIASSSPVLVNRDPPVTEIRKNAFFFNYPSEIFKSMSEIVQRMCSLNAKVWIDQPSRIKLPRRYDVNYFQIYLNPKPSDSYILIKVEEFKGLAKLYCSFKTPNPVSSDNCSLNKVQGKSENYYLVDKPSSPGNFYFAIENFDASGGEFEVTVSYF